MCWKLSFFRQMSICSFRAVYRFFRMIYAYAHIPAAIAVSALLGVDPDRIIALPDLEPRLLALLFEIKTIPVEILCRTFPRMLEAGHPPL